MAKYNYNLDERLKSKRTKEVEKNTEEKKAESATAHGISIEDPYDLSSRLYGHKDRSFAVANGA